ncbi:glycerol-3-phosphate dehydrogenase [Altererythrobacter aerius]|uniref:Glycerol-3-phosphate dehydrogenase n=1 Tax=Tsuneonella aeria TaxID=1837929 RepID=A0A6I4TAP7_9SPHN|nr:glycerol-3-phosphate dehydrogenase [Tsuneonella aeria]MXO74292.1 glycerol-3-phosphate dehydrogenase [Tsuneonella aeria]
MAPTNPPCETIDLLVVGGGINGAGIARDAAGRGLSVLLVERDDLASHTSSASTKLVHGGLRYLEYGEVRLVRESLIERERLMAIAPHIIWPLEFVLPQSAGSRPAWLIRAGLFVYDHLGGRKRLPATQTVRLATDARGEGLRHRGGRAFAYYDCWVDDARLVVLNARDAAERGARVCTRTAFVRAQRTAAGWSATLKDSARERTVRARAIVNAAGPWVNQVIGTVECARKSSHVRLVKGSHIVLPRLYPGAHAFLLQNPDGRVVFAIPWLDRFTLVGTTDEPWHGPPGEPAISAAETDYLLATVTRNFARPVTAQDIAWTYSGIRPLYDDRAANASAVTRDYVLDLDADGGRAPLLSVFGGKITTYRKLAEHALEILAPILGSSPTGWTSGAALPGGDLPDRDRRAFRETLKARHPALPADLLARLADTYGTAAEDILHDVTEPGDLGQAFGAGLTARELAWLADREWARTAEDVLFRRTKLGLDIPPADWPAIDQWLADHTRTRAADPAPAGRIQSTARR